MGKNLTWHQRGKFIPQLMKYTGRALSFPYYAPF